MEVIPKDHKEDEMRDFPNPNEVFPNEYKTSCFIRNVITAPNTAADSATVGSRSYPKLWEG